MTLKKDMQKLIRLYKEKTGEREIDMHDVAKFAVSMGWKLPNPQNPIDMLAKSFSDAAREEIRHDENTGRPYRANHAIAVKQGGIQLHLWIDIDEADRAPFYKSVISRREQMVGDGLQLSLDIDHWNSIHHGEEPIAIPMDLGPDIEWRKNAPDDGEEAA